jgi:BASS family bile acid:Na+ symporter
MEVLKVVLPLLITGSLAALILTAGLEATMADALYLVRHPRKLLNAVLAISVVVPLVAMLMAAVLPLPPPVKAGIILMAVSPLPPLVPGKALKLGGQRHYVIGLLAAFAVLTVVIVPATVELLSLVYGLDISISLSAVARTMLIGVIAPLAIGMLIRARWPRFSDAAAPWVAKVGTLLLLLGFAVLVAITGPAMLKAIGNGSLLVISVIVVAGLAAGALLGGPQPEDRIALAAAAATRHPGIALLIANANFQDKRVTAVIVLFLVVGIVINALGGGWLKRAVHPGALARS